MPNEQRAKIFVDRTAEMQHFCQFLESNEKRAMLVCGEGGLGKSLLLNRMINDCNRHNLHTAKVEWTNTRNYDYLWLMRNLRDQINPAGFKAFTDLVNYFTVPTYNLHINNTNSISVACEAKVNNTTIRDLAGIIIKDSFLVIPRDDLGISESDRMAKLTDQFIGDICLELTLKPTIVFFDAVEKMTSFTHRWVSDELLKSVADGRIPNIKFVLFARKHIKIDTKLKLSVEQINLKPLDIKDISDYLLKCDIDKNEHSSIADMLLVMTEGNPQKVATYVDALMIMRRNRRNESDRARQV